MPDAPKILAFSGSLRADSYNTALVRVAARHAEAAGANVTIALLGDHPMPLFNEDEEKAHGMPEGAKRFKNLLLEADGVLLASPEYNGSMTAVLKNAIDWASRRETPDEPPLAAFDAKAIALLSASPGGLGGIRGLLHLRTLLGNIRMHVMPAQYALSAAHEAFDAEGNLKDPKADAAVKGVAETLVEFTRRVRAS